jgi:hypothetical protein
VKFLFPNKHQVYMHDTPSKGLFGETIRTYSHGCVRVRNPVRLAEVVLAEDKGWPAGKVRSLVDDGPENNKIALDRKLPVHITYFTAWVGDNGKVQYFRDVYGHENRIALATEGRWREIVKTPDHLAPVVVPKASPEVAEAPRRRNRNRDRDFADAPPPPVERRAYAGPSFPAPRYGLTRSDPNSVNSIFMKFFRGN